MSSSDETNSSKEISEENLDETNSSKEITEENLDEIILQDDDDEFNLVRLPIKAFTDKLIDDDNYDSFDDMDLETKLALEVSKREQYSKVFDEDIENDFLKKAIELSNEEYSNQMLKISIEKEDRFNSLKLFSKKIKGLSFTQEDIEIRKYIECVLQKYFNLEIDYIFIEDNLYNKIYKIIDSYYLIPSEKNISKKFISYEEDLIIRSIFLKEDTNIK